MNRYLEVAYSVERGRPAEEALDRLVAEVWSSGVLGCRLTDDGLGLVAYFADNGSDPTAEVTLPAGVREIRRQRVAEQDWLGRYRESASPIEVGERWLLDPREPDCSVAVPTPGRTLLRLPARRAFGTGGHESTRLALRLIEASDLAGRRVVDLGYGSGVLSFAAAYRRAGVVLAIERDLTAALVGGLNRNLNPTPQAISMVAGEVEALCPAQSIDVLMVNARPGSWLPAVPVLDRWLVAGADVLCSGLLASECDEVVAGVSAFGWTIREQIDENDWRALRLRVVR